MNTPNPNLPHPPRSNPAPLKLSTVVPIAIWLKDRPWDQFWVRWFLIYALAPLVLTLFINQTSNSIGPTAWAFGLYFAILWSMVLFLSMRPGKVDIRVQLQVAAFTAIVGIFVVLFVQLLPGISYLYSFAKSPWLPFRLVGFVLGVGLVEEGTKALPLYLLVFRRNLNYSPLMFSFTGAISGLAFGVAEAVNYSYLYARGLEQGVFSNLGDYIIVQFLRLITLPLLHACWSAIVGYFIGLAYLHKGQTAPLIGFGWIIAATLHGLYDTLASGWTSVVMAAVSLLVFISYVRTSDLISREIQAQHGSQPLSTTPPSVPPVPPYSPGSPGPPKVPPI